MGWEVREGPAEETRLEDSSPSPCLSFRCHQMDDFGPAKNLMTMCFTYYHIGEMGRLAGPLEARAGQGGGATAGLSSRWKAERQAGIQTDAALGRAGWGGATVHRGEATLWGSRLDCSGDEPRGEASETGHRARWAWSRGPGRC